jgi:hypothetical protein
MYLGIKDEYRLGNISLALALWSFLLLFCRLQDLPT